MDNMSIEKNIDLIQSIVNRLSNNSTNCKSWCITIVSAIAMLSLDKSNLSLLDLCFLPIILFYFLDSFYLSLERNFIDLFNEFVKKYHNNQLTLNDMYNLDIKKGFFKRLGLTIIAAFNSASTLPFYGIIVVLIIIAKKYYSGE